MKLPLLLFTVYKGGRRHDDSPHHPNGRTTPNTNHKQAVTAITGGYNFDYDANGNMTSRIDSTSHYSHTFNIKNELETVTDYNLGKGGGSSVTTFTYDASGQRVKTVEPDGTITDYPFPGYEVENPGLSNQTVRLTFTLAGQAVAVRVITTSSSDRYYLYNDHLGSTSAIATSSNGLVPVHLLLISTFIMEL